MTVRTLVQGRGDGRTLLLHAPLSFWGGMDVDTGRIIDRHHPQHGTSLTGRVIVMPAGRGSSSSPSVLAEAVRRGTAPAAIVLRAPDMMVALGAIVAAELYGLYVPVVVTDADIPDGQPVRVDAATDVAHLVTS